MHDPLKFEITKETIEAPSRTLRATWTLDLNDVTYKPDENLMDIFFIRTNKRKLKRIKNQLEAEIRKANKNRKNTRWHVV